MSEEDSLHDSLLDSLRDSLKDISQDVSQSQIPLAVIIGMPAAGKTRVGKELAHILNVPFIDTDDLIEQKINMPISQYFKAFGEESFRDIEAQIVRDAIFANFEQSAPIVALGGGAPMRKETQGVLRKYTKLGGRVVYLQVNASDAIERVSWNSNRPMLSGEDGAKRWMDLFDKRDPVFCKVANLHARVYGLTPKPAARKVKDMIMQRIVHVDGKGIEDYDVHIGAGAMSLLPQMLGKKPVRVALIHTQPVQRHSDKARSILRAAGYDVFDILIPDAEAGKTVKVADFVWSRLANAGFTRSDAIVGLGGGAATDLAGFVASTWMRGIRYVNCPTSLLAMVDASTGGKTGVNTAAGKNLVGSFYTPAGVLADTCAFSTLPNDIFVEGLGEVAKSGFIGDSSILKILEDPQNASKLRSVDGPSILDDADLNNMVCDLIEKSVRVKAYHVSNDLKEQGLREFLNYGHTLGHAIEQIEHFSWRHGNAVAVGMVFAASLAQILGYLSPEDVEYHRSLLKSLGLPISWNGGGSSDDAFNKVLDLMHKDKKARGNTLRFVVLDGIGNPIHLDNPPLEAIRDAFNKIRG
ncbi:bifunctional shikimate kinase/3-dehydroquinate synthase [Gardnerella vaginalis]|uniref:bifunctional shikimate kinase/3-dehydroquinate synthase n=1 Tax=Gardnerella vaginalis TaxID=2702 RepID=UPI0039EE511A